MGTKVILTTPAWKDLGEIADYIAKDNLTAAERFSDQLLDCALSLGRTPLVGCRVRGYRDVRMAVHERYLIIYKVHPEKKQLFILRFWHSARDLKRLRLRGQPRKRRRS